MDLFDWLVLREMAKHKKKDWASLFIKKRYR